MKFLLTTYSTAFAMSGGGESEMVQIAETLMEGGHLVDIYGVQSRTIEFYDTFIHFSVDPNGWPIFELLAGQNKNILLWPNFWLFEKPCFNEMNRILSFVQLATKILFKSETERDNFLQFIDIPLDLTIVLPICVSRRFTFTPDPGLAKTIVGYKEYVICLGRVEKIKNQLNLIKAINRLGFNLVLAGGSNDKSYLMECKSIAEGNITFLPFINPCSNTLISLIHGASVVAEPSYDPPGRSALEGAILGKPLVLSRNMFNQENLNGYFYGVDPDSIDSIVSSIEKAWNDSANLAENARKLVFEKNASCSSINHFIEMIVGACD